MHFPFSCSSPLSWLDFMLTWSHARRVGGASLMVADFVCWVWMERISHCSRQEKIGRILRLYQWHHTPDHVSLNFSDNSFGKSLTVSRIAKLSQIFWTTASQTYSFAAHRHEMIVVTPTFNHSIFSTQLYIYIYLQAQSYYCTPE